MSSEPVGELFLAEAALGEMEKREVNSSFGAIASQPFRSRKVIETTKAVRLLPSIKRNLSIPSTSLTEILQLSRVGFDLRMRARRRAGCRDWG